MTSTHLATFFWWKQFDVHHACIDHTVPLSVIAETVFCMKKLWRTLIHRCVCVLHMECEDMEQPCLCAWNWLASISASLRLIRELGQARAQASWFFVIGFICSLSALRSLANSYCDRERTDFGQPTPPFLSPTMIRKTVVIFNKITPLSTSRSLYDLYSGSNNGVSLTSNNAVVDEDT